MVRIIGSVVVGYIVMFAAVFVLFSAAYLMLGAERSYQAGSWDVSPAWIVISVVVGLLAAIAGGYVCAMITKGPKGPQILAIVVVVLGVLLALPVLFGAGDATGPMPRPDTVGLFEAMQYAKQPVWLAFLNPLLGAFGVVVGARLRKGS
jgi:hypothetical protein